MSEEKAGRQRWRWLWQGKQPPLVWLGVLAVAGVVLLSLSSLAGDAGSPPPPGAKIVSGEPRDGGRETGLAAVERELEERLEAALGQIEGVGDVSATVTLAVGPQREYASNVRSDQRTTNEKDQSGGTRVITESNQDAQLVLSRAVSGGNEQPVVVKETRPVVQGVLVVATGAEDPEVRVRVTRAVETLLDVKPHQVQVLPRESR